MPEISNADSLVHKPKNILPKPAVNSPVEIDQHRTSHTKTFINPDGTFTVETAYRPIHYKNGRGRWAEIDNELISSDKQGFRLRNKANAFEVYFATNNQSGNLVRLEIDGSHWISFTPSDKFTNPGVGNKNKMKYKNIKTGMDIDYTVDNNRLKEIITLSVYPGSGTLSFPFMSSGFVYSKDDYGGIWLNDDSTGEHQIYFDKPYATDANGIINEEVSLDIQSLPSRDKLIVTLDDTWLKNAKYPVIIDPIAEIRAGPANSHDTFISETNPDTTYSNSLYLNAGQHVIYGRTRSLIRFDYLPSLPPGVNITSAYLGAYMYLAVSADGTVIDANQITGDWQPQNTKWSNQPSFSITPLDSISDTQNKEWTFKITVLVKSWYSGTSGNYGVILKGHDESTPRRAFLSGDATDSQPRLIINFTVDPLGMESFWGYSGNVNVHNGNLVVTDTDVNLPGKGIPIAVTRTFNSRSFSPNSFLSYGWSSNVNMHLNYWDGSVIAFTNGDGGKNYFVKASDGSYTSPAGVQLTLTHTGETYQLIEKSGTVYKFNTNGKLESISDTSTDIPASTNTTTLTYNSDGTLSRVTDASGRYITFNYASGRLSGITGAQIPTVQYGYDALGNLNSVAKYDAQGDVLDQVSYGYDNYHNILAITDGESNTTTVSYYAEDRVNKISKPLTIGGSPNTLTTTYTYQSGADGGMITSVSDPTDHHTITKYTTNVYGNVVEAVADSGAANITTGYNWDGDSNMVLAVDPKAFPYSADYDSNGNVELLSIPDDSWATFHYRNNDLDNSKDFTGRKTKNYYDPIRRDYIGSNDKLSTTDVNRYDSKGNIVSETNRIGVGPNFIKNSGFEFWTEGLPDNWQRNGTGGTVSADSANHINGNYSLKLASTGNTGATIAKIITSNLTNDLIPVHPKAFYNLSWYVKTQGVGNANGGATGSVYWYDKDKNYIPAGSINIAAAIGTSDWLRKGARVASPSEAVFARVELSVNDSGTAWYDNIQLEYDFFINDYNLLENESFEDFSGTDGNTAPDNWTSYGFSTNDGVTTTSAHTGKRSVLINGAENTNKYFYYPVKIKGAASSMIRFSGWTKSASLPVDGGDYSLIIHVIYMENNAEKYERYAVNFPVSDSWTYIESAQAAQNDFIRIEIYGKLENRTTGQAWFDDFNVRLEGAPDALISSYNIAENGGFEYPDSQGAFADKWRAYNSGTPGTYDISWINSTNDFDAYVQQKMLRISNVPDWATVASQVIEPLKAVTTYSASAVIKTDNVTGSGAVLKYDILDASGNYLTQKLSRVLTGTNDWTWVTVSLTDSEARSLNSNAAAIKATVGTIGATGGTMYFDTVRLQEKSIRTIYSYTSDGNYTTSITNTLWNTVTMVPDSRGNVLSATDPYNNTATFTYDLLDRTKSAENAAGLRTEYLYDKNGNVKQMTNKDKATMAVLNTSYAAYNELGLVKTSTDPMNRTTSFGYDKNGNLSKITPPNEKTVNNVYDALNRLAGISYTNDSTTWAMQYDANNNLHTVTKNGTANTTYEYDSLNRNISAAFPPVNGIKNAVTYDYNPDGQIIRVTNSPSILSPQPLEYLYDMRGINSAINAPNNCRIDFMHDEEGRIRKSYKRESSSIKYLLSYQTYDTEGNILKMWTEDTTGNTISSFTYTYDMNGNRRTEINDLDKTSKSYDYDGINQLLEEKYYDASGNPAGQISYRYDLLGNRTKKITSGVTTYYGYNAANEITWLNSNSSYTHDSNGNLTYDGTNTYAYNARNELIQVSQGSTVIATYEYNYEGLRTKKVAGGVTEYYYYNGDQLAFITNASNAVKYSFTRDTDGNLLNMTDYTGATPSTYWYLFDAHGNVIALADKNTARVANYKYDAWGNITQSSGSVKTGDGLWLSDANPFRYSSYQYDPETSFYYLKSRYYTPFLGRFLVKIIL